jgi:hypothetical protein
MKDSFESVLRYTEGKIHAETLRRAYFAWRQQQSPLLPERCDNPHCQFHTNPLVWNGKPLKLTLDHENGVNSDNRPENLRLLCANCDSQLTTRGGGNKGRVDKAPGGFAQIRPDGWRDHTMPAESGKYTLTGGDIGLSE